MEVKGAALLYTLATLGITFAGFSALLLIIRQTAGGSLSALDRFLTRTLVGHLTLLAATALLPAILALYDVTEVWIWKVSALAFGLPMLALLLTYQRRRAAITGRRAPPIVAAIFIWVATFSIIAMIGYVFGNFEHPAAAYVSALTVTFVTTAYAFVMALEVILSQQAK